MADLTSGGDLQPSAVPLKWRRADVFPHFVAVRGLQLRIAVRRPSLRDDELAAPEHRAAGPLLGVRRLRGSIVGADHQAAVLFAVEIAVRVSTPALPNSTTGANASREASGR